MLYFIHFKKSIFCLNEMFKEAEGILYGAGITD